MEFGSVSSGVSHLLAECGLRVLSEPMNLDRHVCGIRESGA